MDADQLQQFIDGMKEALSPDYDDPPKPRPREIIPDTISEVDSVKWISFRRSILKAQTLNAWDDDRAKLILQVSVKDAAARAVHHLEFPAKDTLEDALDKMETIFVDAAATKFFKAQFNACKRQPQETLVLWHTRVRQLFMKSYPKEADEESSELLKDRFTYEIEDIATTHHLINMSNYGELKFKDLLTQARQYQANAALTRQSYGGRTTSQLLGHLGPTTLPPPPGIAPEDSRPGSSSIQALSGPRPKTKCFHCQDPAHMVNACPLLNRALERVKKNPQNFGLAWAPGHGPSTSNPSSSTSPYVTKKPNRGRGRGRGRGYSRGRGRGGGSAPPRPGIMALDNPPPDYTSAVGEPPTDSPPQNQASYQLFDHSVPPPGN